LASATATPTAVAASVNRIRLKAMVDQARTKADARAAQISSKAQQAGDKTEAHWNQVQSDWDRHVKQIRQRIDAKKAEHDADMAERDAEWAEATHTTQFSSHRLPSRKPSTLCSTLCSRGATPTSWPRPPSGDRHRRQEHIVAGVMRRTTRGPW
jgi:hypothetical protein